MAATSRRPAHRATAVSYCAPANAILLSSGLTYGQSGRADHHLRLHQDAQQGQDAPLAKVAQYKIVATQAGISPDDAINPAH